MFARLANNEDMIPNSARTKFFKFEMKIEIMYIFQYTDLYKLNLYKISPNKVGSMYKENSTLLNNVKSSAL